MSMARREPSALSRFINPLLLLVPWSRLEASKQASTRFIQLAIAGVEYILYDTYNLTSHLIGARMGPMASDLMLA